MAKVDDYEVQTVIPKMSIQIRLGVRGEKYSDFLAQGNK